MRGDGWLFFHDSWHDWMGGMIPGFFGFCLLALPGDEMGGGGGNRGEGKGWDGTDGWKRQSERHREN